MVKRVEHSHLSQCPLACALDILGDHWSLLLIREMMFEGVHEYKDMLRMVEGIASNILSDRLKKLEDEKIIAAAPHPDSKRRKLYYLTAKGKDLIFVILEFVRWAAKSIPDRAEIPIDKVALLECTPEQVAEMVFAQLEQWEKENLKVAIQEPSLSPVT